MLVNGIIVHHQSNVYRLYLRDGTGLAEIRFPNSGDTDDEVSICIKKLAVVVAVSFLFCLKWIRI